MGYDLRDFVSSTSGVQWCGSGRAEVYRGKPVLLQFEQFEDARYGVGQKYLPRNQFWVKRESKTGPMKALGKARPADFSQRE